MLTGSKDTGCTNRLCPARPGGTVIVRAPLPLASRGVTKLPRLRSWRIQQPGRPAKSRCSGVLKPGANVPKAFVPA